VLSCSSMHSCAWMWVSSSIIQLPWYDISGSGSTSCIYHLSHSWTLRWAFSMIYHCMYSGSSSSEPSDDMSSIIRIIGNEIWRSSWIRT
jgi:hypothetical protein